MQVVTIRSYKLKVHKINIKFTIIAYKFINIIAICISHWILDIFVREKIIRVIDKHGERKL